jgi:hypothetical protein
MKQLEKEYSRLKKAVAELTLDKQILKRGAPAPVRGASAAPGVSERRACRTIGPTELERVVAARTSRIKIGTAMLLLSSIGLTPFGIPFAT